MTENQTSEKSRERAKEFVEKFCFKKKLEEIINSRDESLIPILSANIAIFGVSLPILFISSNDVLSAPILLILISSVISLLSVLLNIWYLTRLKERMDFFKTEQEKIFNKAESNIIKVFNLIEKTIKSNLINRFESIKAQNITKDELSIKLKEDIDAASLAEETLFIPITIMELALKETTININRCFDEPLDEKYSSIKLYIDRLSDKSKYLGLILSSAFVLAALLIKFIVK